MELKEIISSGLLELYSLGLASGEETAQVEGWIISYPEVRAELEQMQLAMEDYAMAHSLQLPANTKNKIFTQLNISLPENFEKENISKAPPSNVSLPDISEQKSRTIQPQAVVYSMPSYLKWAAAACVALLLGSLVMNYTFYNRYRSVSSDLQASRNQLTQQRQTSDLAIRQLQEQQQNINLTQKQLEEQKQTASLTKEQLQHQKQTAAEIQQELERQKDVAEAMNNDINVMTAKNSLPVVLSGTPHAPDALAKIFWMKNTGEVYVDPTYLPKAPAGKQYQLWAIIDGKPVNGGMISTSKGIYHIQKMKSFGKADAFAITLEKAGGSPTPNMKEMYVMAKI